MRQTLTLVAAALAVATCGPCSSTQPIEGYWTWRDGVIQIRAVSSGSFEGVIVTKPVSSGVCAPDVGRVVLKVQGSGTNYSGQDEWFRVEDCAARFSTDAKVSLSNGNNTLRLCSHSPFVNEPQLSPVCEDSTRITNYKQ